MATYSVVIPTTNGPDRRPYFNNLMKHLGEHGILQHPLVKGFHVTIGNPFTALWAGLQDLSTYIIYLEDDAYPIRDFISCVDHWVEEHRTTRSQVFYPLWNGARGASKKAFNRGESKWDIPINKLFGSTAVVFPRSVAYVLHQEWLSGKNDTWRESFDVVLKDLHHRMLPNVTTLSTPIPCMVDKQSQPTPNFDERYHPYQRK